MPRRYARLCALAVGIPLLLALLAACSAGTAGGGGAPATRPRTPILLTYRGHSDRATAVAWSPDSKEVVSGSLDTTVQVWSATTGKMRLIYRGHTGGIVTLGWSPDGRFIASSSLDNTIQVWNAATGAHITTYRGHRLPAQALSWSPNSRYIVSGSPDQTVQVWDARTGRVRYRYDGSTIAGARIDNAKGMPQDLIFFVAWSHNGKRIAVVSDEYSGDVIVITWDAPTGKHLVIYPDEVMYALAWSPDDTRFASAIELSDVEITLVP